MGKGKIAMGLALLAMSACSKPPAVAVVAPPPPAPVGHIYPTLVPVPPPASKRVKLTAAQQADLQQAFNVIGLKSALMVGALSCNQQDKYDVFMRQFQPHILAEQHVMDAYFHRMGGYGQSSEDTFVTLLANNQSVSGIAEGAVFCLNNEAEFRAVLALKTPSDLDAFVTNQSPNSNTTVAANQ
jgi:hypothetical protein